MRCPMCAEMIDGKPKFCPYCGESLEAGVKDERQQETTKESSKKNKGGILLLVCVIGGSVVLCGIAVLAALILPAVQQSREAARRTQCKMNLKQIGMAALNYSDVYNRLPAAHLNDNAGTPRISWRVSILPYIEEAQRFKAYDSNQAWDGPTNSKLLSPMPVLYNCPSHFGSGRTETCYVAPTGDHTAFASGTCARLTDITDGVSSTLMVVEACDSKIPWMQPKDLDANTVTKIGEPQGIKSDHAGGVHVLLADGTVRFIRKDLAPSTLKMLLTRDDGEVVGDF